MVDLEVLRQAFFESGNLFPFYKGWWFNDLLDSLDQLRLKFGVLRMQIDHFNRGSWAVQRENILDFRFWKLRACFAPSVTFATKSGIEINYKYSS